jgi:hypothetical protein
MINISYIAPKRYSIPSTTLNAVDEGRGLRPFVKMKMFILDKLNVAKKYQVSNTQINNDGGFN